MYQQFEQLIKGKNPAERVTLLNEIVRHAANMSHATMTGSAPFVVSTLQPAVFDALKESLIANLNFNRIFYNLYQSGSEEEIVALNRLLMAGVSEAILKSKHSEITSLIKSGFEEDVKYFTEQLTKLETNPDQQRVLDDIYEKLRYNLFIQNGPRERIQQRINLEGTLFKKLMLDSSNELFALLEPNISKFQKCFIEYNELITQGSEQFAKYKGDTPALEKRVRDKLLSIQKVYVSIGDKVGNNNITKSLNLFNNDIEYAAAIMPYNNGSPSVDSVQKQNVDALRAQVYFLHKTLIDAEEEFNVRYTAWAKKQSAAKKQAEQKPIVVAAEAVVVPVTPPIASAAPTAAAEAAAATEPTQGPMAAAGAGALATGIKAPLLFQANLPPEKPKADDHKTSKNVTVREHPLAKLLAESHYKTVLEGLFTGQLSKIKMKVSQIKNLLEAFGCSWSTNGVRTTFAYKGKIGFSVIPISEVGGYHTKSRDNTHGGKNPDLHAVVLEHVKDFLERVGVTPHALWPSEFNQFQKPLARDTEGTNIAAAAASKPRAGKPNKPNE